MKKTTKCSECGNKNIIYDNVVGELICEHCGLVISYQLIDLHPEWRYSSENQNEKRSRTGLPLTWTIHDQGLSTLIDRRRSDYQGRKLRSNQINWAKRAIKWNKQTKISDATEKNLVFALSELNKIAYKLRLPRNVLEMASINYRRCVKQHLTRGRSILSIAHTCLYIACRQCGIIRTFDEVSKAANITKKELFRHYLFIKRKLNKRVPRIDPTLYISLLVNHLSLSGKTEYIALKILKQVKELRLTEGRNPRGIAAASTYVASLLTDEKRTQDELAKEAHVTEVTIRNRYRELMKKLDIKINL